MTIFKTRTYPHHDDAAYVEYAMVEAASAEEADEKEWKRYRDNLTAQSQEELRAQNRQRKREGWPPIEGYPDGYK